MSEPTSASPVSGTPESACWTIQTIPAKQIANAAIVVIRTPPRESSYSSFLAEGLESMAKMMRPGGLIVFLRPDESLSVLPESEMAKYGWVRESNPEHQRSAT